jgi:hypothetical protein
MTRDKANVRVGPSILQVLGFGVFVAGCVVLLAVFSGYRRPLRSLGIGASSEIGILLLCLGAFIALLGGKLQDALEAAARDAIDPVQPTRKGGIRRKIVPLRETTADEEDGPP